MLDITWKEAWRCGTILDRIDYDVDDGVYTEFWVEYKSKYFYATMKNGVEICFEEIEYPWSIV